jgi:hypothetical protein
MHIPFKLLLLALVLLLGSPSVLHAQVEEDLNLVDWQPRSQMTAVS